MSSIADTLLNAETQGARLDRHTRLAYRPDIDGLRAIAVLSVVTYHFFPAKALGGFVGVDIFFVISGFLISTIIYSEVESGTFSLREFYVRRICRIYPALFLILSVGCVAGWFLFLPSELALLGKQVIGGSTFSANFVLWSQSGYFSHDASHKPLLHLWSLGVEEQFYLIFPLICIAFYRAKSRSVLPTAFLFLASASMVVNIASVSRFRDAAFFLPFSRLWELLVGAGLSLCLQRNVQATRLVRLFAKWRTFFGILGLAFLMVAIFEIDQFDAFPGWLALLPTVGAAFVIAAGRRSWVNRHLLSSKPVVFVGLISYPFYLWHWPILCLTRIATNSIWGRDLSPTFKCGLICLSFLLAYVTYRFIELPLRKARRESRRKSAVWLFAIVSAAGFAGLVLVLNVGFPARFPSAVVGLDHDYAADAAREWREGTCFLRADQLPESFSNDCLDSANYGAVLPVVFVWGDSHAADLIPGLRAMQSKSGARLAQYTSGVCPPIIGLELRWHPACSRVNEAILDRIRGLKPDIVVLSAYWDPTERGQSWGTRTEELIRTISLVKLAGVPRVIVIGSAPNWTSGVPALVEEKIIHDPKSSAPERLPRSLLEAHDDTLLRAATKSGGAEFISLFDALCDETSCVISTGPTWRDILTFDRAHFTEHGSILVAESIWPAILNHKS